PKASDTCEKTGVAGYGEYANLGSVVGTPEVGPSDPVTDDDPSHYYGIIAPAITIKKYTNGHDADNAPGPDIPVGDAVTWTYEVKNTGNVTLTNITVTDDQGEEPIYQSGDDGDNLL